MKRLEAGRGRVVYAAAPLAAMYFRYSLPNARQILLNDVEWAAGEPPPASHAGPETVEVAPWRDAVGRRTLLHFINRTGVGLGQTPGQMMHEVIPVHDVTIRISPSLGGTRVVAQPGDRPVPFRTDATGTTITLPKLAIWDVLEITPRRGPIPTTRPREGSPEAVVIRRRGECGLRTGRANCTGSTS